MTLTPSGKVKHLTGQYIALLDIFGFENFEKNRFGLQQFYYDYTIFDIFCYTSFEQLLINYCNEKIQFHFNSHIFVIEQEAYSLEGINIDYVNFRDNSPTLAVIEKKLTGILEMVNEEINIPEGSDVSLLNKILRTHLNSPHVGFGKPKRVKGKTNQDTGSKLPPEFAIQHYAGEVVYDVTGFLEKNKDSLSIELRAVGKLSSKPLISEIFREFEPGAKQPSSSRYHHDSAKPTNNTRRSPTIATQFKKQLSDLVETLNSTSISFIRCMKTNEMKKGNSFDCKLMLKQLQYSGLLEVCRIRREGYPFRLDFQGFYCLYKKLFPLSQTGQSLAKELELKGLFGSDDYRIGKSKIFLKYSARQKLEQWRGDTIFEAASKCQSVVKMFLARKRMRKLLSTFDKLSDGHCEVDRHLLTEVLQLTESYIPNEGRHLSAVSLVKASLARLNEEEPLIRQMKDALKNGYYVVMEAAVAQARSMDPPFSHPLVAECQKAMKEYVAKMTDETTTSRLDSSAREHPPKLTQTTPPAMCVNESSPQREDLGFGMWGKPSAIRAARGKMVGSGEVSVSVEPKYNPVRHLDNPSTDKEPEKIEEKIIHSPESPKNDSKIFAVNDTDQIVGPKEDFLSRKKSILKRQLSSDQMSVATEVHHMIEELHQQCESEIGVTVNDTKTLEIMIKKINSRDCSVSKEVAELMMAEQELIRAKKQILLQTAIDKVKSSTPLWKLKNLEHQARQIGMTNYHGKLLYYLLLIVHLNILSLKYAGYRNLEDLMNST